MIDKQSFVFLRSLPNEGLEDGTHDTLHLQGGPLTAPTSAGDSEEHLAGSTTGEGHPNFARKASPKGHRGLSRYHRDFLHSRDGRLAVKHGCAPQYLDSQVSPKIRTLSLNPASTEISRIGVHTPILPRMSPESSTET